jgi:hypothetical protein
MKDLPLQVGNLDRIRVDETYCADSGLSKG